MVGSNPFSLMTNYFKTFSENSTGSNQWRLQIRKNCVQASRGFNKSAKLAILALFPTLYSDKFAVIFIIYKIGFQWDMYPSMHCVGGCLTRGGCLPRGVSAQGDRGMADPSCKQNDIQV